MSSIHLEYNTLAGGVLVVLLLFEQLTKVTPPKMASPREKSFQFFKILNFKVKHCGNSSIDPDFHK